MDVTQNLVVSTIVESSAQRASVLQVLEGDRPVPCKPKVEEHEVLSDYRSSRATKVERERIFNGAEIMEFENKVLREEILRAPDDPTDANLSKTKLICSVILST